MTFYLYPHNNPEITTGQMAVYREPKPDPIGDCHGKGTLYDCALKDWQTESLHAYLIEPEFKRGSEVYVNGDKRKYIYVRLDEDKTNFAWIQDQIKDEWFLINIKDLSHFRPGQKMLFDNLTKWQEVKEPEEDDPKYMKPYYIDGGYAGEEFDRDEYEQDLSAFKAKMKKGLVQLEQVNEETIKQRA